MSAPLRFGPEYREKAKLSDGTAVILRLVRPSDKGLLVAALKRSSPATVYRRFFAYKTAFSAAELKYLTELDQVDHFAIGAVSASRPRHGLGIARFVRVPGEPGVAEPALAVFDAAQGKGLGKILLNRLVAAARERGVRRFRSTVLVENAPVRGLIEGTAGVVSQRPDPEAEGAIRMEIELPESVAPAEGAPPTPLQRVLALAAQGVVLLLDELGLRDDPTADGSLRRR